MCGIIAAFERGGGELSADTFVRATKTLSHRGPDACAHWIAPQRNAALGHTRLSVIDLSGGHQPIANEDNSIWIITNGEFYDFEATRTGLERRGHRFRTGSDSEIALHLYEDFGVGCLEHLRGEFAFVIFDERNRSLFAARDRFGIKPVFYANAGHTLWIASEVCALFAGGVPPAWSSGAVYSTLFFCPLQGQSLFQGIQQILPGHYLLADDHSLKLVQYWDLDYPQANASTRYTNEGEILEEFRPLLDEAVRIRMRADVPIGCYLSGGIDSSSMLSLGARHATGQMTAFTVAFDGPDFDESPAAARQAAFTGAKFERVTATEKEIADAFPNVVGHGEMVHYNAHGVGRWLLSRAVRQSGYKVVLSGEGADELFLGYDFLTPALSNSRPGGRGSWVRWLRLLLRRTEAQETIGKVSPWLSRACQLFNLPDSLSDSLSQKFALLRSMMSEDFLHDCESTDIYREFIKQLRYGITLKGRETPKQLLYLWSKSMFANYVLAAERLDMAHAVEVRLPFLDHRLFEFVRSIPSAWHTRNGIRKILLRESVKSSVTEEVYGRRKQPFYAPAATLRPGSALYQQLQDCLRSDSFTSMPFFNRKSVVDALDRLRTLPDDERASVDPAIFAMASLSVLRIRYRL